MDMYYSKFTHRVKGKCSDASVVDASITITRSVVSLPLAVTSSSGVLEKNCISFVKVLCTNISQAYPHVRLYTIIGQYYLGDQDFLREYSHIDFEAMCHKTIDLKFIIVEVPKRK